MGEHVAITMSVLVPLVHALLVLFPISAAVEKCSRFKAEVELKWIPEYEKFHKGLGLNFDCEAMKKADDSARKLKANNGKNYQVGGEWCQYSRLVEWGAVVKGFSQVEKVYLKDEMVEYVSRRDPVHVYIASPTVPLDRMPLDDIKETAKLHPNTKYGCSARTHVSPFRVHHSIVCIYKKIGSETRCTYN